MTSVIFYSWQSDLPNATNRGFIQRALEKTAKAIAEDEAVEHVPVIDRDTQGVPGSPHIAATILEKIRSADVVVADVSIINGSESDRPAPNPNVLVELGYALASLGQKRIVLVMNTAYGAPEKLPFDLKMYRVMTYEMPETTSDRTPERNALQQQLRAAIGSALTAAKLERPSEQPPSSNEQFGSDSQLVVHQPGTNLIRAEWYRFVLSPRNIGRPARLNLETEQLFTQCMNDVIEGPQFAGAIVRTATTTIFRRSADVYQEQRFGLAAKGGVGFVSGLIIATSDEQPRPTPYFVPLHFCKQLVEFLGIASLFYERANNFHGACVLEVNALIPSSRLFPGFPIPVDPLAGAEVFHPKLDGIKVNSGTSMEVRLSLMTTDQLMDHLQDSLISLARPSGSVLSSAFETAAQPVIDRVLDRLTSARAASTK